MNATTGPTIIALRGLAGGVGTSVTTIRLARAINELTGAATQASISNEWNTTARDMSANDSYRHDGGDIGWVVTERATASDEPAFTVVVGINDFRCIASTNLDADAAYVIEQPDRPLQRPDIENRFKCPVFFDPAERFVASADDAGQVQTAKFVITQPLTELASHVIRECTPATQAELFG